VRGRRARSGSVGPDPVPRWVVLLFPDGPSQCPDTLITAWAAGEGSGSAGSALLLVGDGPLAQLRSPGEHLDVVRRFIFTSRFVVRTPRRLLPRRTGLVSPCPAYGAGPGWTCRAWYVYLEGVGQAGLRIAVTPRGAGCHPLRDPGLRVSDGPGVAAPFTTVCSATRPGRAMGEEEPGVGGTRLRELALLRPPSRSLRAEAGYETQPF